MGYQSALGVSMAVNSSMVEDEGTSLAEWPENKFSFQHQFVRYIQSRMRYPLIVI